MSPLGLLNSVVCVALPYKNKIWDTFYETRAAAAAKGE